MRKGEKYFGGTQEFYQLLHIVLPTIQSPVSTYAQYEKKHNTKLFHLNIYIIIWLITKHLFI